MMLTAALSQDLEINDLILQQPTSELAVKLSVLISPRFQTSFGDQSKIVKHTDEYKRYKAIMGDEDLAHSWSTAHPR
jgi:hypothetical protein